MTRGGLVFAVLLAGATSTSSASDDAAHLLRYVPDDANVVGVTRVAEVLKSPRAEAEDWADRQQGQFLAGSALVPPSACSSRPHPEPRFWS